MGIVNILNIPRTNMDVISRRIVLTSLKVLSLETGMSDRESDEKMDQLNKIFLELIQDANDLTEDLINGIHLNFVMGAVSIVFAIQSLWYNRIYIIHGDWVPVILSLMMIISGLIIINRGFILRDKYSRLYQIRNRLKKI